MVDEEVYAVFCQKLVGRSLLQAEVVHLLQSLGAPQPDVWWTAYVRRAQAEGWVQGDRAMKQEGRRGSWPFGSGGNLRCQRCGSGEGGMRVTACAACGKQRCAYCTICLGMGRVRSCSSLWIGKGESVVGLKRSAPVDLTHWGLSRAQQRAVEEALTFVAGSGGGVVPRFKPPWLARQHTDRTSSRFLIWAVTGAGKTEMIFPLIERVVASGGRALLATPRQDVVKELYPRLQKAFPDLSVAALYGGSGTPWDLGAITLATTHQLLRFQRAFDLVIIDELDAFPYHGDPMLHFAADKAGKPGAPYVLLSATPPPAMQRDAKRGRLPHVKVPARYHGHPLPVPKRVGGAVGTGRVSSRLLRHLRTSLDRGAQVFLFVPRIDMVEPLVRKLRVVLQDVLVEGTSSVDAARSDKVLRFRGRESRVLVTTTILERGVTVPKSDVFILDAEASLFDEAALVQMAGRAGRSAQDPAGRVVFFSRQWTRSQRAAIRHIRAMNREASRRGYLTAGSGGGAP